MPTLLFTTPSRSGEPVTACIRKSFRQSALARRTCEVELKRAVAEGELELYYQPQLRLADRRIVGAEALLRWKSSRARADPARCVHPYPGAQHSGRSGGPVDRAPGVRVRGLRPRCRASRFQGRRQPVRRAVAQRRSQGVVTSALDEHRLSPDAIELELTESIVLHNDEAIIHAVRDLAAMGSRHRSTTTEPAMRP